MIDPVLLQQVINGLSLGAMYALLALGFTLVYGILELINFAHFNVFMVSSFVGMWALELLGISGQSHVLTGFALHLFVNRTRLGKAMRATAQDAEAARMMGIDVDRVVVIAFFLGSALAGAAALIFGLYYNFTSFIIGYTAGLRAFTAAVLGGIGSVTGAMVGGVLIGLIESLGGHFFATRWADVIIFSILILVLVFVPSGLFGRAAATRA